MDDSTGYILVSDQQANKFRIFPREGEGEIHHHSLLKVVHVATNKSDGSDVIGLSLPGFSKGLFVAMSDNGTLQLYRWEDIAGRELKSID